MAAGSEVVIEPSAEPTKPPSPWQRVITGIICVPLAGLGLLLIALGVIGLAAGCGDDGGVAAAAGALNARPAALDESGCFIPLLLLAFGVPMALVGVPFTITTFVPFGTFRRVMVGVGVAAIGGIVVAVALLLIQDNVRELEGSDKRVLTWTAVVALPAAAGFFYLGYRIAR